MALQIEVYKKIDAELLVQWQQLWQESSFAHFFNSPQWFSACTNIFPSDTYRIVVIYDNNKPVVFFPLCIERKFGIKTLTCPGGKHLAKSTLLVKEKDRATLLVLMNFLSSVYNCFYLPEISAEIASMVSEGNAAIGMREASVNPYIPLDNDPFLFLSKKQRSKIFNRIRKNEDRLTYRCYKGSVEGLKIAFAIDRRSSKRKEGKPAFATEHDRQLFYQLIASFQELVTIDVLFYDNVPIVFGIGFVCKNIYHACNTAYNEHYRHLSPRKLLLYYTLHRLKKESVGVFDFSRGVTTLKQEFTLLSNKQFDLYYTQSRFQKYWWNLTNNVYRKLLENKVFYQTYLMGKKLFIMVGDKLTSRSFEIENCDAPKI